MTVQEFHINFGLELDKTADFEYAYMSPEQIDYWLNKAQERFIKQRAYPLDRNKPGFEQTQKRIDDLRDIVVKSGQISPSINGTIYSIFIPGNYKYLVRHQCLTSDSSSCGNKNVGGVQAEEEFMNQMLKDPFWWPTAEEPLYYFNGDYIVYETKGNYSLLNTVLTYIKEPAKITLGSQYSTPIADVQCELGKSTHQEILDIAISMVLENIESQRYQTNLNELTKTE